jgi:hypothetical protein
MSSSYKAPLVKTASKPSLNTSSQPAWSPLEPAGSPRCIASLALIDSDAANPRIAAISHHDCSSSLFCTITLFW